MSVADSTTSNRAAHHPGAAATWPTSTTWTTLPDAAELQPRRAWRTYRRDQLIAGLVAAGIHVGALFAFNGSESEQRVTEAAPAEEVIRMEMPVLEPPETVEVVDVSEAPGVAPQLAPPMLMDLPSAVPVSSFVEPMRPQVDPSLTSVNSFTIPSVANPGIGAQLGRVRLFDLKDLDRVPRRVKTVMPVYPHDLRRSHVTGEVILVVIIDVNGRVEVERVESATNRDFELAAVRAAEQCEFEPPLRAGQRVNARYRWHIPFEMK
jgi:TonB family protein